MTLWQSYCAVCFGIGCGVFTTALVELKRELIG